MNRAFLILVIALLPLGCQRHNVSYQGVFRNSMSRRTEATYIHGTIKDAFEGLNRAQLPHLSNREKAQLAIEAYELLTDQIGSPDYILIAGIAGAGGKRTNESSLALAMCKKAAKEGGDLIMVFSEDVEDLAYTHAYSTTHVFGSLFGVRGFSSGSSFSGVMHLPTARGVVFRHVPGVRALDQRLLTLSDEEIGKVVAKVREALQDRHLTIDDTMDMYGDLVARKRASSYPRQSQSRRRLPSRH